MPNAADAVALVEYEGNFDTLFAQTRRAAKRTGDILARELNGRSVGEAIGRDITAGLADGIDAGEAGRQIGADLSDGAADGFDPGGGITSKLDSLAGPMGAAAAAAGLAAGAAAGAALVVGFQEAVSRQADKNLIQAQLGITEAEAAQLGSAAGRVYANNFGDEMGQVRDTVVAVRSSIGAELSTDQVEVLSQHALTFAEVMGTDVAEGVATAGQLIRLGLAKDGTEAFDLLLASGQQMPSFVRGELLPTVSEYGTFLASLGFTGQEAFELLIAGSQGGTIALDKTGDALKELSIRATDMSETSVDAYEAAGLNATEMADAILAGGDTARGAFDQIVTGLLGIPDPTQQAVAAIGLFGTPLEDLGVEQIPEFLRSLQGGEDALDDFAGTSEEAADALGQGLEARLESLRRRGLGALVGFIDTRVLPTVDNLIGRGERFASNLADRAEPAIEDVSATLGHLRSIGEQAYDSVVPVGEVLATIGGGAVLVTLSAVAGSLEATLGLIERNEGAVHALTASVVVLAGAAAWPAIIGFLETMYIRWLYFQGAVTGSAVVTGLRNIVGGMAGVAAGALTMGQTTQAGFAQLQAGLAAVGPTAGMIAVVALGLEAVDSFKDADAAAREWADGLDDNLDIANIETYEAAFAEVQRTESEAADKLNSDGGFFGALKTGAKGALEIVTPMENTVLDAAKATGEASEQFDEWAVRTDEMAAGLEYLREELGLTAPEIRALSEELEFGEAEIRSGRAAFLIRRHLRGLAEEAGYTGPQIRDAVMLTPAQLEEQRAQWEELSSAVSTSWGSALDAVTGLGSLEELTGDSITEWYNLQTVYATEFAGNIQKAFELGYDPQLVSRLLQAGPAEAGPIVQAMVNEHSADLLWIVNAGEAALQELNAKAVEMARLTHLATTATSSQMAADLGAAMRITEFIGAMGANATASAIARELGVGVDEVIRIAGEYGIALADGVNPILNAVGADPIVQSAIGARYAEQAKAQHRNAGGPIFGPNVDRDVVPAMLTPGEFVHRKSAVDKWGLGAMAALNDGQAPPGWVIPGFNAGGAVLLEAGRRLQAAGARITEHPAWDRVDPVHVPGSFHYRNTSGTGGDAFDANYGGGGASAAEQAFFDRWAPMIAAMGLRVLWRVAGHFDHMHVDLGRGGGMVGPHFPPLPEPPSIGGWPLARGGEGAMRMAYDAANEWMASLYSPAAMGGVGTGNMSNRQLGQAMAAARGWTGGEWSALNLLWDRESGWNHLAANPTSGAYGIPQSLPGSKMASHGSDWRTNPGTQIAWGLDYIGGRYGSPSKAWAAWNARSPHWYRQGGPVEDVFVHRRTFDQGGTLDEGWNLVNNTTGADEQLVPAGAPAPALNVEGDLVVRDRTDIEVIAQKTSAVQRRRRVR